MGPPHTHTQETHGASCQPAQKVWALRAGRAMLERSASLCISRPPCPTAEQVGGRGSIIGLNPQFYQHGEPESELLVCRLIAMFGRGEWLCSGFSGVVWWTLRAGCFTFCVLGAQFSTLFSSPLSLGLWRLQEALAPMGKSRVDSSWSESSATGCQHS